MLRDFFEQPCGVGTGLNIRMFSPRRLKHLWKLLLHERRYLVARGRVIFDQLRHPSDPWLTRDAIEFLQQYLRQNMYGFEFGSGRSTKWLARRIGRLVSVEDNPIWYRRITQELVGLDVDYRFASSSIGCEGYVGPLLAFPDETFDFIIIDGNWRDACVAAAARKVKRSGIIVIDNADERRDVSPLGEFTRYPTDNGVWQTDIYVRV